MKERGNEILALQFEQATAGFNGLRCHQDNRADILKVRATKAEAELARCRRALESSRAISQTDRAALAEAREEIAALRRMLAASVSAHEQTRRSWQKASALLRMLPPEQVASLRAERDA